MEEAEVLCDRVAIMAEGRLRCIGSAADIKHRFGDAFKLTIHTTIHTTEVAVQELVGFLVRQSLKLLLDQY